MSHNTFPTRPLKPTRSQRAIHTAFLMAIGIVQRVVPFITAPKKQHTAYALGTPAILDTAHERCSDTPCHGIGKRAIRRNWHKWQPAF